MVCTAEHTDGEEAEAQCPTAETKPEESVPVTAADLEKGLSLLLGNNAEKFWLQEMSPLECVKEVRYQILGEQVLTPCVHSAMCVVMLVSMIETETGQPRLYS